MATVASVQVTINPETNTAGQFLRVAIAGVSKLFGVKLFAPALGTSGDQRICLGYSVGEPAQYVEVFGAYAESPNELSYTSGTNNPLVQSWGSYTEAEFGPAAPLVVWYKNNTDADATEPVRVDLVVNAGQPTELVTKVVAEAE